MGDTIIIHAADRFGAHNPKARQKYEVLGVHREESYLFLEVKKLGSKNEPASVAISRDVFPNAGFRVGDVVELTLSDSIIRDTNRHKVALIAKSFKKHHSHDITPLAPMHSVPLDNHHYVIQSFLDADRGDYIFVQMTPHHAQGADEIYVVVDKDHLRGQELDIGQVIHAKIDDKKDPIAIPFFDGHAYEVTCFTIVTARALANQPSNPSGRPKTP